MRFIITARPKENAPAPDMNAPIDDAVFTAHMKFNEEMYKAGVRCAAPLDWASPTCSRSGR